MSEELRSGFERPGVAVTAAWRTRGAGPRPPAVAGRTDEGSATIWVLAASGLLVAVAYAVMLLASVQATRQRAEAAADLAALAGAQAGARGADACSAARSVAAADGAELETCAVLGAVVAVTAAARLPPALSSVGGGWVRSRARAGPVPAACPEQGCVSGPDGAALA